MLNCIADSQGGSVHHCKHLQPVSSHSVKAMASNAANMAKLHCSVGLHPTEIKSSKYGLTETLQQLICMLSVVSNAIKQAHCTTVHHNSAKATCNNRVDSSKPHACTQLLFSARSRELHSKICHHRTDSYHTFNTIKKARQGQDLRLVTGYQQSQSTAADSGLDGIPDMPQVLCP